MTITKKGEKTMNKRYEVYIKFNEKQLIWVKSFKSYYKNNRRCAKYWIKKMQKETNNQYIMIEAKD